MNAQETKEIKNIIIEINIAKFAKDRTEGNKILTECQRKLTLLAHNGEEPIEPNKKKTTGKTTAKKKIEVPEDPTIKDK